jgi:hypothetical protein
VEAMAAKKVQDITDLMALVELVRNNQRAKAICVVTTPISSPQPTFSVEDIEKEVGDLAQIFLVQTGDLTRRFVDELSPKAAVFNGAAKIFTPDWETMEEWPRLFYCHESYKVRDTDILIDQIWKLASDKDLERFANLKAVPAEATVSRIMGARAFVLTSNGELATVRQEITCPGIPLEWWLPTNTRLNGKYNEAERLFLPRLESQSLDSLVEIYGYGNLALVLVKEAERKKGIVTIYPGIDVQFTLEEISGNERDLVTDFLEPGQVVAMRLYRDPQGRTRLKMNDIDDDEVPVQAVPVIAGGSAWLVPERDIPIEETSAPVAIQIPEVELVAPTEETQVVTSSIPIPQPGTYKSQTSSSEAVVSGRKHHEWIAYTTGLTKRIESFISELKALRAENTAGFNERNALKRRIEEISRNSTSARRKIASKDPNKSNTRTRRDRWSTNEDWFNEELRRVWISRYKPEERNSSYPLDLSKFSYGPMFFESVFDPHLTEDELRKAVRAIVDIVTGREAAARQNRVHNLRESDSPSASQRTRPDGSKAWRANIEDNTPQARRLHYWKDTTGLIELAKVAKHDDFSA